MTDWHGREWDAFGKTDPYFGVIAEPAFHGRSIDARDRAEFFARGVTEIANTLDVARSVVGPTFRPARAMDFGCGVGRLTMPLAANCSQVVGIDISPAMTEEASRNCAAQGIHNVAFATSIDEVEGTFDFVHSFIVFQHIPPKYGLRLFDQMLGRLRPHGGGMVHFTYARSASVTRKLVHRLRRSSKLAHRLLNLTQGRSFDTPLMAMFEYDLRDPIELLRSHGCERIAGRLTDHGGHLGLMLFFGR